MGGRFGDGIIYFPNCLLIGPDKQSGSADKQCRSRVFSVCLADCCLDCAFTMVPLETLVKAIDQLIDRRPNTEISGLSFGILRTGGKD